MKNKSYLCFRFDIDTHKCIRDGVPPILALFKKYNRSATFFLNTGKSIEHNHALQSFFVKKTMKEEVVSLSALKKLGPRDYLQVLLFNPTISKNYKKNINDLINSSNEIGLHGGHNHEEWHYFAKTWGKERAHQEIKWGIEQLKKYKKDLAIEGFASPGWNGSSVIDASLSEMGFSYVSDIHTDKPDQKIIKNGKFHKIPTNISGEPGGVGYIEHCRAKGMSSKDIIKDFRNKLEQRKKFAIIYDHPYYVGVQEIDILEEMIKVGLSMKFSIIPMRNLLQLP